MQNVLFAICLHYAKDERYKNEKIDCKTVEVQHRPLQDMIFMQRNECTEICISDSMERHEHKIVASITVKGQD